MGSSAPLGALVATQADDPKNRAPTGQPNTRLPVTQVEVTLVAPISSAGPANGSRSRTTRSATWPGARMPAPSIRSRPLTHAEPDVYAANAVVRSSACSGRNGLARVVVRRAVHRGVDRGERVGRGDRPVAAHDEAGAGAVQVAERVLPRRALRRRGTGSSGRPSAPRGRPTAPARWRRPRATRTRHVVGVHQLEVGDVVPQPVGPVETSRHPGGLERVERLTGAPVADRVHVHLEAGTPRGRPRSPSAPRPRRRSARRWRWRGRARRGTARASPR